MQAGEIVDAAVMSAKALSRFVDAQIDDAKAQGVLFSLHLKATMMKVSDPIMFGVVVERFYRDVLAQARRRAASRPASTPNNGIGDLYARLPSLPEDLRATIEADIAAEYARAPGRGDGQLRQGHHQPARAERRDRRRLDAGDDPRLRPHVERRRQAAGHQGA